MDRSIAVNAESETLYDKPEIAKDKLRITGPFTVEAVATGAGKTTVMAMVITWQVLNALTYPFDATAPAPTAWPWHRHRRARLQSVSPPARAPSRTGVLDPGEGHRPRRSSAAPGRSRR